MSLKYVMLYGMGTADPSWWSEVSGHWLQPVLAADQPGGKPLLLIYQQQSRLNYKRKVYTVHMGVHLEYPAQVNGKTMPLDATEHLLH